jgi:hypothetical protein
MKHLFYFCILAGCLAAAAAGPAGSVQSLVGTVESNPVRTPGWKPARLNAKIFIGDQLRAAVESMAEVRWANGGVVRLAEQSTMTVTEPPKGQATPEPGVKLLTGRVWANMKKISSTGKEFGVETPTALAAIRGTVFRVDMAADSSTDVLVYEGSVAVGAGAAVTGGLRRDTGRHEIEGPNEVEGPKEVTVEEWVTIVAGQQIHLDKAGSFRTWQFDQKADSLDSWVKFNQERDKAMEKKEKK